MKLYITAATLFFGFGLYAQVGIGTSTPSSELEIKSNGNIPSLELNPQLTPRGTASGQLSVIGDELYLYDTSRAKWLSVESSTLSFGREGGLNNVNLEYAGDVADSGPAMPKAGTIVYTTLNSSGGNQSKGIVLRVYNNNGTVKSTHPLNLSGGRLIKNDFDVDFSEGDYFRVRVSNGGGNNVNDVSMVLWIKWRKENP